MSGRGSLAAHRLGERSRAPVRTVPLSRATLRHANGPPGLRSRQGLVRVRRHGLRGRHLTTAVRALGESGPGGIEWVAEGSEEQGTGGLGQ